MTKLKNMKTRITATAPTVYQLKSLSAFGIKTKNHLDGSFSIEQEFESEEAAKNFLKERANIWAQSHSTTEDELEEMIDLINTYGSLTLDAVTASVEIFNR